MQTILELLNSMTKANFIDNLLQICWLSGCVLLLGCSSIQSLSASEFGSPSLNQIGASKSGQVEILPVDDAFRLTSTELDGDVVLYWQIQPGYYLYRRSLDVAANKPIGELSIPQGIGKTDEYFGKVEVFFDELEVIVPIEANLPDETGIVLELSVAYQGCAEAGICYPPQNIILKP